MPRLPRIERSKLVKAMKKDVFFVARIEGSHYIMQKVFESGEKVTVPVPVHKGKILKLGDFGILREARIDHERLIELL
jgi:predicted RNA binding protein YcfA (HicA-like mRNA interferase family)